MQTKKLKKLPKQAILLGRGKLTWMKSERVSDRYGTVWLMGENDTSLSGDNYTQIKIHTPPIGQLGRLIARVTDARESTHIGDFFRNLFPRTPKVGDIILLGEGLAFAESKDGVDCFGLKPQTLRQSDWLNPRALYDCHESMVELIWCPTEDKTVKAMAA